MAVLYKILRDFTLVCLDFLGKVVHCECLLKQGSTFVFLIGQNAFNGGCVPLRFPGRGRDTIGGQFLCNCPGCLSCHKIAVYAAHGLCLLLIDNRSAVRSFLISEKIAVGETDFSV